MPLPSGKALKRKSKIAALSSRKKARTEARSADDLPWKVVSRRQESGIDDAFEGVMELEEVDGVQVVYEETDGGKVARFHVSSASRSQGDHGSSGCCKVAEVPVEVSDDEGLEADTASPAGSSSLPETEVEIEETFDG